MFHTAQSNKGHSGCPSGGIVLSFAPSQNGQDRRRASNYRGVLGANCAHTIDVHDLSQRFGPEGQRE
jgi:hypothetical protein